MLGQSLADGPARPATRHLVDIATFVSTYYTVEPDADDIAQRVAFGTSGHRGSSLTGSFNEAHIVATTQAICEYRAMQSIDGPLFIRSDTHAAEPAWATALEVLAANDVTVLVNADDPVHAHAGHLPCNPAPQRRPHDRCGPGRWDRRHAIARRRTAASSTTHHGGPADARATG